MQHCYVILAINLLLRNYMAAEATHRTTEPLISISILERKQCPLLHHHVLKTAARKVRHQTLHNQKDSDMTP